MLIGWRGGRRERTGFSDREAQTRWAEGRSRARCERRRERATSSARTDLRLVELVFTNDLDRNLETGLLVDGLVDVREGSAGEEKGKRARKNTSAKGEGGRLDSRLR